MTEVDPEVGAMGKLANLMSELPDDDARGRVLEWANRRFNIARPKIPLGSSGEAEKPATSVQFETFADLFDAVGPNTDKEKAVAAAYWVTKIGGASQFQSQELNQLLKDLGHGVSNITDALTSAMQEKPAMILQLKKSGTSRQARKTYKPTNQAVRWIEDKISAGGVS